MPTYQYACKQCDHRFEVVQSFSDASLTECPECAGTLRKLYGAVGVIFKGSGFYRNDARSDSSKPSSKPAAADAKSESKPESKSESTPAKSDSSSTTSAASSSSTPTKAAAAS